MHRKMSDDSLARCRRRTGRWISALMLVQVFDGTAALILPVTGAALLACSSLPPPEKCDGAKALDRTLIFFLACYLMAALLGQDTAHSLVLSMPALPAAVAYVALAKGACQKPIVAGLALAGGLTGCAVLLSALGGDAMPEALTSRMGLAWLVVPNDILVLACLFPWMREWIASRGGKRWTYSALTGGFVFLAAWLLQSRIAMMGTLLLVAFDVSVRARIHDRRRLGAIALLAAVTGLVVWMAAHKGLSSGRARLELWREAACVFARSPVLGVGPHNFAMARRTCASEQLTAIDGRNMPWPHNLWLEIAAETGMVGLIAGGMVLLAAFDLARRCLRETGVRQIQAPVLVLLTILVFGLVEITLLRLWVWSLAAIALGWLRACGPTSQTACVRCE